MCVRKARNEKVWGSSEDGGRQGGVNAMMRGKVQWQCGSGMGGREAGFQIKCLDLSAQFETEERGRRFGVSGVSGEVQVVFGE